MSKLKLATAFVAGAVLTATWNLTAEYVTECAPLPIEDYISATSWAEARYAVTRRSASKCDYEKLYKINTFRASVGEYAVAPTTPQEDFRELDTLAAALTKKNIIKLDATGDTIETDALENQN